MMTAQLFSRQQLIRQVAIDTIEWLLPVFTAKAPLKQLYYEVNINENTTPHYYKISSRVPLTMVRVVDSSTLGKVRKYHYFTVTTGGRYFAI